MQPSRSHFFFLVFGISFGLISYRTVTITEKSLQGLHHSSFDEIQKTLNVDDASLSAGSTANSSYFDKINKMLYAKATADVKVERQPFVLEGWKRGSGGLDDEDRKTLGELYSNANSVFEFGLGESTLIAARVGVPRYAGIDSDAEWVNQARQQSKQHHFRFYYADIGDVVAWGNPRDETLQKIQYDYQVAPLVAEDRAFDVYLVDGRYRVACACISFLHAMKHGIENIDKVRVGVHDNDEPRRDYHVLKKIADVITMNKKLWVYKLKNTTTEEDVFRLWQNFTDRKT